MSSWSWTDFLDLLVKLAPAATIIGAIIAAKIQFRSLQRINAETIAKNHYRAMLETLLSQMDLVARGSSPELLASLRKDPIAYGRYAVLFGIVTFAMQEIYFATDAKHNKHWATVIRSFMGMFRTFMESENDFSDAMDQSVHPEFGDFIARMMAEPAPPPVVRRHDLEPNADRQAG